MARTKAEYKAPSTLTVPDSIPEGMERVTYSRYLERAKRDKDGNITEGTDRKVTRRILMPAEGPKAGAGIVNLQKLLSENGINGNDFVSRAVRNAMVEADFAEMKRADENSQPLPDGDLQLSLSAVRVTDEAEAAGTNLTDWLKANPGQVPPQEVLDAIFAGIAK